MRKTYHGVLSHQDNSLSTERATDLVHLLGRDIVDGDDEDGAVLLEQALQLIEVAGLVCGLAPHSCLFTDRMFKGQDKCESNEMLSWGSRVVMRVAGREGSCAELSLRYSEWASVGFPLG